MLDASSSSAPVAAALDAAPGGAAVSRGAMSTSSFRLWPGSRRITFVRSTAVAVVLHHQLAGGHLLERPRDEVGGLGVAGRAGARSGAVAAICRA